MTLAALEQRFRGSPEAAAYVRAMRLRATLPSAAPSAVGRRALRAQLRGLGLGALGRCGRFCRAATATLAKRRLQSTERPWKTSTSCFSAGPSCSRRAQPPGDDPACHARATCARQDLDPRGARPRAVSQPALRAGRRRVPGGDRPRAHERLRAVLPRPLAADARPPRRGAQAARAGGLHAARPRATTASTATARGRAAAVVVRSQLARGRIVRTPKHPHKCCILVLP